VWFFTSPFIAKSQNNSTSLTDIFGSQFQLNNNKKKDIANREKFSLILYEKYGFKYTDLYEIPIC